MMRYVLILLIIAVCMVAVLLRLADRFNLTDRAVMCAYGLYAAVMLSVMVLTMPKMMIERADAVMGKYTQGIEIQKEMDPETDAVSKAKVASLIKSNAVIFFILSEATVLAMAGGTVLVYKKMKPHISKRYSDGAAGGAEGARAGLQGAGV